MLASREGRHDYFTLGILLLMFEDQLLVGRIKGSHGLGGGGNARLTLRCFGLSVCGFSLRWG